MVAFTVAVAVDDERKLIRQDFFARSATGEHMLIQRQIMNLAEENIVRALHALGWRHVSEQDSLQVPNAPSAHNPKGLGFHTVTVADVRKMERQIRRIASTLHL